MLNKTALALAFVVVTAHQAICFIASPPSSCSNGGLTVKLQNQAVDTYRLRGGSTTVDELKIEALRAIGESLRRGGHGTARRKFQKIRKQSSKADEAKFQSTLKRLNINAVSSMEEVRIYLKDGTVLLFKTPKVHCNVQANAFVLQGEPEIIKPPNYGEQANQDQAPQNEQIDAASAAQ